MDKTLQTLDNTLSAFVDGGAKKAEEILSFIEKQTPLLMDEIIRWGVISELVAPIVGLAFIVFAVIFHSVYKKWGNDGYYGDTTDCPPLVIVSIFSLIIGGLIFLVQTIDVIYPLVAPRMFILDKIKTLL